MKTLPQLRGIYATFNTHTKRLKVYQYAHLILTDRIEEYIEGDGFRTEYWNTLRVSNEMWDINFYDEAGYTSLVTYLVNPNGEIDLSTEQQIEIYYIQN